MPKPWKPDVRRKMDAVMKDAPNTTYKELARIVKATNKEAAYYLRTFHGRTNQHDFKQSLSYQLELQSRRMG